MSRSIVRSKINAKYNPASVGGGGGGTPASPDKAIQYNSGGVFGANSTFIYDYPGTPTTNTSSLRLIRDYDFLTTPMAPSGAAGIQIKNSPLTLTGNPGTRYPFITSTAVQFQQGLPTTLMRFQVYNILSQFQISGFKCDYSVDVYDANNTNKVYTRVGTLLVAFPERNNINGDSNDINVVDSFIVSDSTDPLLNLNFGFFTAEYITGDVINLIGNFTHITLDSMYFTGLFTTFMTK